MDLNSYFDFTKWFKSKDAEKLLSNQDYKIYDERTEFNSESPTGRVYIEAAKKPLESIINGHGYKGVLLQTDNRMLIQCHNCGKWFRRLTAKHLAKHKLTVITYREKYGLLPEKALISDELSYSLEERGRKTFEMHKEQAAINLSKNRDIAMKKAAKAQKKIAASIENKNRFKTCPVQMPARLMQFLKTYKMLPMLSPKGGGRSICRTLAKQHGSVNLGFAYYKLPSYYRQGSNVELKAINGKQLFFNYNQDYSRQEVWNFLVENSPFLKDKVYEM